MESEKVCILLYIRKFINGLEMFLKGTKVEGHLFEWFEYEKQTI